jgi:ribosome-associated translation inhibitor RaiA
MLNIEIKKSSLPLLKENRFSSSKKIIIDLNIEVVIQINFSQKNVLNIIENLIIDLILSHTEKERDVYNSFSFILEKLNKEIKKLSKDSNFSNLNIFI